MKYLISAVAVLLFSASALAATSSPAARLDRLLAQTRTFSAHFTETVANANAVTVKRSSGTVAIAKPGRFRWNYEKPYKQIIVADGEKLWIYDPALEQVTVRNEPRALATGPAALLAGTAKVEESFTVSDIGKSDGLAWLELVPESDTGNYRAIRIGLAPKGGIRAIELDSKLDQTTRIDFNHVKRNAPIDSSRFQFTPPPGADVVHQSPAVTVGDP